MHSRILSGFALGLLLVTAACGGGTEPEPAAPAAAPAAPIDAATAGHITGKVMLEGTAPANEAIRMNADPACLKVAQGAQMQETWVVGPGGEFGNVFVYVKDGLGDRTFTAPTQPLILDQQGCRYHPHVFGIMVGQPLEIVNNDPTLHNIHATPAAGVNTEFNTGQPIQGMKTEHVFTRVEVLVPFKCDVHGWMNAFVGVVGHPFFSVSAADGTFALNTLPPGTYTIEAVHERLGSQTQTVTIGEGQTQEITFTFQAPASN
jgi:plastocyanin